MPDYKKLKEEKTAEETHKGEEECRQMQEAAEREREQREREEEDERRRREAEEGQPLLDKQQITQAYKQFSFVCVGLLLL